ncbi:MAG TPA: PAS domain S-box protein, partial [Candidatus Hydrogenedentes bacterium]|nr:PAS domain S-box protein [Candidatus Hydrogenedentota bacterium]
TNGVITTFNRAASAVLGYSADEAVGRPFRDVFGRDFHAPPAPAAMALRAKSGRAVPVAERDSPIADRQERRLGQVKVFQDLSELEALRQQLRQVDRLAAIGEMAATVAHEIRNPLGGIRGFAALLARDIPEDDPRGRLVQKILTGTKNLDRVVNELLEYTRPVELRLRPTSCADLIEAAVELVELDAERVAIYNDVEPGVRVLADSDKMRQVILNILLNAVQSIDGRGEVRVRAEADDKTVTVAIADTGCGIAPEHLEEVFSPFYTTKEKGTGLGLAVAAKVLEGHGGSIHAESEPGKGSTFYLQLPRAE